MDAERLFEIGRRTFDTPHFGGIEFIEVEAKSIINRVPGTYLPFNWTINVYRGCSHACSYCMSGDTPILMGDGRTKPLAEVRAGDAVYGTTVEAGSHRRYAITEVLDHWATVKPAYRVVLRDGTELVASGDHRFLTEQGWKHVAGTPRRQMDRAHLTVDSSLVGIGRFATGPRYDLDYRLGYLCGLIRGNGFGPHGCERPSRKCGDVGRVAPVHIESLRRARDFLASLDAATVEFALANAVGFDQPVRAIRMPAESKADRVRRLIGWPQECGDAWCRGFLAGIFDAGGSFSSGVLRIASTDREVIDYIRSSLDRLGFAYALESTPHGDGPAAMPSVRLEGSLHEKLRFFHTADPAIASKRGIAGAALESAADLRVAAVEPLGMAMPMYDITTGTGDFIANGVVSHNCFARATHTYMDLDAGRDFESKIFVKVNAPELLRKELRSKRWAGDSIAMGTATDPYQRAEGRYGLTRKVVEVLAEYRNPFSILTKGTLILRDLDLLAEAAAHAEVTTAFSVGTLDDDVWRRSEPGTPHPAKRLQAVRKLNEAGVPCGVLMAPVLPGISDSDEQMRAVVEQAVDAGATHISPILLHLRPKVREVYMEWLRDNYPDLVERYEAMYTTSYASPAARKAFGVRAGAVISSVPLRTPSESSTDVRRAHRNPATRTGRAGKRVEAEQMALL